ncbi:hypothetical protein FEM48_Zijuj01G0020300 [Ziziphus jujuba var. spinosa]|uniref:Uncharacterized protein n=1 Tax=Ziziphus jujuba var. spinosa TaxID=714518 RepID=A0A978VYH5_ZIZJJ|nr:hypothetical protein FEM48_Zijuj01G0020300 [Ziziphus jujuba var. spinosa]
MSSTMGSSMGTVEVEVFSNTQLVIMTILMIIGGEVFVSMLGLQLSRFKLTKSSGGIVEAADLSSTNAVDHPIDIQIQNDNKYSMPIDSISKYNSIKCLGYVVLGYLLVVHKLGYILVTIFMPTNENMIVFKKNSRLLLILIPQILLVTVFGFMLLQFLLFCALKWNFEIMDGLNPYKKFMASLFEITNVRCTGELVFDFSTITLAILVLFIVMM